MPNYSQGRSSVPPKILLINWLFEKWIHESFPLIVSNSNRHSCMRNELWIFYENFSVFGRPVRLKIFKWIKFVRRHLHQIQWVGRNFITASRENSRLITHARMRRKIFFCLGACGVGWYSLLRRNYISKFWAKHSFYDPTLQKCCSGFGLMFCSILSEIP